MVVHEERVLMQAVARGDEAAVQALFDRFGALVFRHAYQALGTRAEAEDLVQDVFVQVWRTADRFDPTKAKLVTWVMLITRRSVIDRLRRRAVRPKAVHLEDDASVSAPVEERASAGDVHEGALRRRLDELPALQRDVIERIYLQGFTLREVSQQMNVPLGTVKSALSRGLARVRTRLGANEQAG
jgi:RNA polymerase sigma factor (sigma-70 family)